MLVTIEGKITSFYLSGKKHLTIQTKEPKTSVKCYYETLYRHFKVGDMVKICGWTDRLTRPRHKSGQKRKQPQLKIMYVDSIQILKERPEKNDLTQQEMILKFLECLIAKRYQRFSLSRNGIELVGFDDEPMEH